MSGFVYLVGAGPGDPKLLTVRAAELLRWADVIVHDRLVSTAVLAEVSDRAVLIDVGKTPDRVSIDQRQINHILIAHARRGMQVVRLKGGDPFVFGRGGEEALELTGAGIPWEVVPGVSSAIAAPALAGIPLTHRSIARGFTVRTSRSRDGSVAIPDAPTDETLVLLMSVAELPNIVGRLRKLGRDPSTPIAIIERASTSQERVLTATLEDVLGLARVAKVRAPATIVVGETVRMRSTLRQQARSQPSSTRTTTRDGQRKIG